MAVLRRGRFGLLTLLASASLSLAAACTSTRAARCYDAEAVRLTTRADDVRSCQAVGPPIRTHAGRLGEVAVPNPEAGRIRAATARVGGNTALVSHNGDYATAFSYRCGPPATTGVH